MKVKVIKSLRSSELENDINEFIKDKTVIDIKYQLFFTDRTGYVYSGVIMYDETK